MDPADEEEKLIIIIICWEQDIDIMHSWSKIYQIPLLVSLTLKSPFAHFGFFPIHEAAVSICLLTLSMYFSFAATPVISELTLN